VRWLKPWLYSVAILIGLLSGCGKQHPLTQTNLLRRLPSENAALLRLDIDALRKAGILNLLSAGKASVDSEYQTFLNGTGFDYQRDLDEILGSFSQAGTFLILKGRFDWPKLEAYAGQNGGSCYDHLCRMPGSAAERRISYLPLAPNLMAMAVTNDDLAASRMTKEGPARAIELPSQPVWLTVSGAALQKSTALPPASRIFTSALTAADAVTLTLGQAPAEGGYEAKLSAQCKTDEDARVMSVQLTKLTGMLKSFMGKNKSEDFGSAIAAGSFSQSGTRVDGVWPIRKGLLESLASAN